MNQTQKGKIQVESPGKNSNFLALMISYFKKTPPAEALPPPQEQEQEEQRRRDQLNSVSNLKHRLARAAGYAEKRYVWEEFIKHNPQPPPPYTPTEKSPT